MRIARREVWVNGGPVRYKVAGTGEPVVLVHGLSGSTEWWRRNVEPLARRYRVYLVDLPGFGTMRRSRLRQGLDEGAHWLQRWMEAIGLRRAHLIGHSMGGYICLRLAALRPDMVHRLVLAAPAVMALSRSLVNHVVPLVQTTLRASPRFVLTMTYDALRAGPMTLLRTAHDLVHRELRRDELSAIQAPTLLVWGEGDPMVPARIGTTLRQHIPTARLHIVRRGGHVPMFDQSREFNAAVLAFLEGQPVGQ
jgi:pimeloyl-ACP methyl ester carboxylesterase